MKKFFKYIPIVIAGLMLAGCQSNEEENFDNKIYINATDMRSETIIKGQSTSIIKTLNIESARPVEQEVTATSSVDPLLVDIYNKAYYSDAELLPEDCYSVIKGTMTINVGSVKSSDATISFHNLSTLDRSKTYVLPITINANGAEMLSSAKNYYYVFRAGALINVAADIEKNYLEIYPWATADQVTNMKKITMEALVYPREFGKLISTIMGIEGSFLMRIGDAGLPDNQLQIATSSGNFTDSHLKLPTGVWSHVAMTYDTTTGEMIIYINGSEMARTTMRSSVYLGGNGNDRNFQVGRSYSDDRDFRGLISEVRIWNVIRTKEEIASHIYNVDPTTEGLVAYWKFDDQSANIVKDYSGNHNDLKAMRDVLKWKSVSLPAQ